MVEAAMSGARLDRLPYSRFHTRLLILIGLGIFFDTFDVNIQSGVLGALIHSGQSTLKLNAMFISATFVGMAIGAFAAGIVGDTYGRRVTYQFNLLIFGLASLAAAAMPSMGPLIAIRTLMGVGLGAEVVVGYSMLTEFMPPAFRGRAISLVAAASMMGAITANILSFLVIPHFGWQPMFVIGGVGAMIVWFLRKNVPESPRWLESRGRDADAARILDKIEGEVAPVASLSPVPAILATPRQHTGSGVLFSRPVVRRTLLVMLINVVVGAGAYGFTTWLPTFLVEQGFSITRSLGFNAIMQSGSIAGPLLGVWLADTIGRKNGIILTSLIAAVLGVIYPLAHSEAALVILGFLMVAAILLILTLGLTIYSPELFPTEYRMRGNGLGQTTGRLTSILVPFAVVALFSHFGVMGVTASLSALFLTLALAVGVFGIETRNKSLEAIAPDGVAKAPPLSTSNSSVSNAIKQEQMS